MRRSHHGVRQVADFLHRGGLLFWVIGQLLQVFHNSGTNDHTISQFAERVDMFRLADSETDGQREAGLFSQPAQLFEQAAGNGVARSGRSGDGDAVHETGAALENLANPFTRGCRGNQLNQVQTGGLDLGKQFARFVTRQVGHNESAESDVFALLQKRFGSNAEYDGEGDHRQQWWQFVRGEFANAVEDLVNCQMLVQCPRVGGLNDGTVGNGVAVGKSNFDQVDARAAESADQLLSGGHIGIASGDEGHEGHLVCLPQVRKSLLNPRCQGDIPEFLVGSVWTPQNTESSLCLEVVEFAYPS